MKFRGLMLVGIEVSGLKPLKEELGEERTEEEAEEVEEGMVLDLDLGGDERRDGLGLKIVWRERRSRCEDGGDELVVVDVEVWLWYWLMKL
jgi:hypothetical protein